MNSWRTSKSILSNFNSPTTAADVGAHAAVDDTTSGYMGKLVKKCRVERNLDCESMNDEFLRFTRRAYLSSSVTNGERYPGYTWR